MFFALRIGNFQKSIIELVNYIANIIILKKKNNLFHFFIINKKYLFFVLVLIFGKIIQYLQSIMLEVHMQNVGNNSQTRTICQSDQSSAPYSSSYQANANKPQQFPSNSSSISNHSNLNNQLLLQIQEQFGYQLNTSCGGVKNRHTFPLQMQKHPQIPIQQQHNNKSHYHISAENGRRIKCVSWTIIGENLICISALSLIYMLRFYILISVMIVEILLFAIFLFNIHRRKARDQHVSIVISAVAGLTLFYLIGGIVVLILVTLKYKLDISVIILIVFIVVYLVPRIVAFCLAKFGKLAFKPT